jgi:uncharacterized membrane-anchored protein
MLRIFHVQVCSGFRLLSLLVDSLSAAQMLASALIFAMMMAAVLAVWESLWRSLGVLVALRDQDRSDRTLIPYYIIDIGE